MQQQNSTTRMEGASVTAALAAVHAESSANFLSTTRFPGEDGGYSLAEMAQRDLDAALQLLVNRAQYITGASGAAIALRRQGRNDMLCRASSGSNAPELGALLSTEFGLSGESVRTRQALRCDDAERDARVNHEVCHQLGIASVMVMPVVNDDGVLGVLELFSGKANAFGARDLSAVQRLSEMVETAVRLAQVAESLPERLMTNQVSAPEVEAAGLAEEPVLDGEVFEGQVLGDLVLEDSVLEEPVPVAKVADETRAERPGLSKAEAPSENEPSIAALEGPRQPNADALGTDDSATLNQPKQTAAENAAAAPELAPAIDTGKVVTAPQRVPRQVVEAPSPETVAPKKPLFWSAALNSAADAGKPQEPDQSHVPPVLRGLRKCEACGFPVSASRVLCVECEEKKWRGQLRVPQAAQRQFSAPAPALPTPKVEARAFAAAAQSVAVTAPSPSMRLASVLEAAAPTVQTSPAAPAKESKEIVGQPLPAVPTASLPTHETAPEAQTLGTPSPAFVLSAGLAPTQSWLSANKYILGVLVVIGAVAVAVFLLR